MATASECSCKVVEKYLVARGRPGNLTGYLACRSCLTDKDIAAVPGWKGRLATGQKKAEQLDKNLGRVRNGDATREENVSGEPV
jgi:hypothetical protein